MTLRPQLSKVWDRAPSSILFSLVYRIRFICGKVYIGETRWRLVTKKKMGERRVEHVYHRQIRMEPPLPDHVGDVNRARRWWELLVKEALHIHHKPEAQSFNGDVEQELPC